jgi:membrane protein
MAWLGSYRSDLAWADILKSTYQEVMEDRCLGLAAQLAFYFLLALFPALLFVVALVGYLPIENLLGELLSAVGAVAPQELVMLLRSQLDALREGPHRSLLTLGVLGAMWSSSAAMAALIDALNHAYDVSEWRPWWKRRVVAILLTLALVTFVLIALVFLLVGPDLAIDAASWLGLAPAAAYAWQIARWPVIVVCAIIAVDLVYHFAPNRRAQWAWVTPGSVLATVLWIAISFGFQYYVANFGNYTATYGAIGAAIITMLWFYVSGVALLIGAELNSVIEQAPRPGSAVASRG